MAEAAYTRPLDALRRQDEQIFGGKSASLGELLSDGIPVPPGFALSTEAFHAFLTESGLEHEVADALAQVAPDDLDSVEAASRVIRGAMRHAPVPGTVREEIASRYSDVMAITGEPQPPVAVRSSAVGEDSEEATFAGQQETYLWMRGVDRVCDAVRDCWLSLYGPPAISYRARLGSSLSAAAMGVTVQLMVDAEVSGVMFTCNPVSGDPSIVAVNASWGLGLTVVGGEVTPDEYLVSKITREVVRERVHRKEVRYVPDPDGRGTARVDVPSDRQEMRCLDQDALAALVGVARRVERHFGSHQDIEWVIARNGTLPDSLFVVQSRPVTGIERPKPKPPADAMSLVMGTFGVRPASPGD